MAKKERFIDQQKNLAPVTASSKRDADLFDYSKNARMEWLNPISMSQLQTAVKARKKVVYLNGDKFTIEYGHMYRSKLTEDYECVLLKRADGNYFPMGYVRLSKILAFDFEATER